MGREAKCKAARRELRQRAVSESSPKIYGALARVMAEVGHVGKERQNKQQGYAFRGVDDVMAAVQSVLAKHGVVVVPQVREREREQGQAKSGNVMISVRLLVDHHFFAEDGSSVVTTTLGEAMDTADKASNKAMSAALKYALVETLMIPTYEVGNDADEETPDWQPQSNEWRGDPRNERQPQQQARQQQASDGPEAAAERLRQAAIAAATHDVLDDLVRAIVKLPPDLQGPPKAAAQGRRKALGERPAKLQSVQQPVPRGNDTAPTDGRPAAGWERGTAPDSQAGTRPRGAATRTNGHVSQGAVKAGEIDAREPGMDDA